MPDWLRNCWYVVERQALRFGRKMRYRGISQSACLAYPATHSVQPEKATQNLYKALSSHIGNFRLVDSK